MARKVARGCRQTVVPLGRCPPPFHGVFFSFFFTTTEDFSTDTLCDPPNQPPLGSLTLLLFSDLTHHLCLPSQILSRPGHHFLCMASRMPTALTSSTFPACVRCHATPQRHSALCHASARPLVVLLSHLIPKAWMMVPHYLLVQTSIVLNSRPFNLSEALHIPN